MSCDQCQATTINGVFCHETGCPNAWKHPRQCRECGQVFNPESRLHYVGPCCTDQEEHECDFTHEVDNDICGGCGEHAGHCRECGATDCCG